MLTIGASEMSCLFNCNKSKNLIQLYKEKLENKQRVFSNDDRGHKAEKYIIGEFLSRNNLDNYFYNYKNISYVNSKYPFLSSTPDCIVENHILLECKTINKSKIDIIQDCPNYIIQVQQQYLTLKDYFNIDKIVVGVAFCIGQNEIHDFKFYNIPISKILQKEIIKRGKKFMEQVTKNKLPNLNDYNNNIKDLLCLEK